MNLVCKFWIESDRTKLFGKGPVQLLTKVDELGSLRKAAFALNMSYSKAWHLIANLEKHLGYAVLEKKIGGSRGGSSTLTLEARDLIERFLAMESELNEHAQQVYSKYFEPK